MRKSKSSKRQSNLIGRIYWFEVLRNWEVTPGCLLYITLQSSVKKSRAIFDFVCDIVILYPPLYFVLGEENSAYFQKFFQTSTLLLHLVCG